MDPVDEIGRICDDAEPDKLARIAAVLGMDKVEAQRDELRGLWVEWLGLKYDSSDLLRRVKLAVHGPLRKPGNAGVAATAKTADGGCNSKQEPDAKAPELCRWPGCVKPTGSPVMAYCKSHRGGPIPHG